MKNYYTLTAAESKIIEVFSKSQNSMLPISVFFAAIPLSKESIERAIEGAEQKGFITRQGEIILLSKNN